MQTPRFLATALLSAALLAVPASAQQRDPAYQAARTAGQVGEQPDGYLGTVGTQGASVRAMVDQINIRRRAAYTERASTNGSTVEEFAFASGCNLILQTAVGEKYLTPAGQWATRTAAVPTRDPRCP